MGWMVRENKREEKKTKTKKNLEMCYDGLRLLRGMRFISDNVNLCTRRIF
jgi:hypothetical protein